MLEKMYRWMRLWTGGLEVGRDKSHDDWAPRERKVNIEDGSQAL